MAIQHEIPVIDISPFLSPSASQADKDAVVDSVRDACTTYGFFQLTGHGIPLELQNTMLDCARAFFDLPQEKKDALSLKNAIGLSSRGYEIIGGQTLQTGMLPDLKEVCPPIDQTNAMPTRLSIISSLRAFTWVEKCLRTIREQEVSLPAQTNGLAYPICPTTHSGAQSSITTNECSNWTMFC